ncbi:hypothetical protein GCM10018966_076740 [Streptomyces yanii]
MRVTIGYSRSMIVTFACPPPSHIVPTPDGPLAPLGPWGLPGFGSLRRPPAAGWVVSVGYNRSMIVTFACPPPSHIVWRP